MRSGEIFTQESQLGKETADLEYQVMAADNPTRVQILLKKSKKDVFRQGARIHLGHTDNGLCPVSVLFSWMIHRGSQPGLLFHFTSRKLLS